MQKPAHVHRQFTTSKGEVTLRELRQEDLDSLLIFINTLVEEKLRNRKSSLYTGFDKKYSRREEAKWLADTLREMKQGSVISMIAEVDGRIIANGEITRGGYKETRHYGHLGLTMVSEFRGRGIGRKMIETLVGESRRRGLRTLEAEFLADNASARRAYEKAGFKQAGLIPNKVYRNGKYFDGLIMARKL